MSVRSGLRRGQGRRLFAATAVMALGLGMGAAPSFACPSADKVWVCKVVGPANDYRLQTGNNPIHVAIGSTQYNEAFDDSHPSFVVASDSFALCEAGFPSEGQVASVVAPTITTAPSCNAPGVVTALPSDGYTWNVSTDGTTYTAVPKTVNGHDYILSGQTEFTFDIAQLTGHQCQGELTPVTAEASATPGSCAAAGQVVLGDNEGYLWSDNTGTADEPIYTATATDGFALTASGEFAFHGIAQLTGHQCQGELTPVTAEASATLGSCAAAGHVTLGDSEGYLWSDNTGTADEPIYTATANTGYLLTASGEFKFHGISKFDPQSTACFVPPATTITTLTPGPATIAPVVTSPGEVEGIVQEAPTVTTPIAATPAVRTPAVTTPAATTPDATTPAATTLAFTGSEPVPLSLFGLLALILGVALTAVGRRQGGNWARE